MKNFFPLLLSLMVVSASAQTGTDKAPYEKFPNNIPMQLLMLDSNTVFTPEGIPDDHRFIVIIFSPECEHCKKATEDIIANIGLFRDIDIVMATPLPFDQMKKFYEDYQLSRFPNIIMGRDTRYMLPSYYNISYLPFHAFYGPGKKLIGVSAQGMTAAQMAEQFKK